MGGHLPSAARSNSVPVLFTNYLRGDPTVIEWAHAIVGEALIDAEQSALAAHRRALEQAGGSLKVITGTCFTRPSASTGEPPPMTPRDADAEKRDR